jgi:hypothetical protein
MSNIYCPREPNPGFLFDPDSPSMLKTLLLLKGRVICEKAHVLAVTGQEASVGPAELEEPFVAA